MSSFHLAFSNCHFHINLQLIECLPLLGNFSRQLGAEIVICSRGFFFLHLRRPVYSDQQSLLCLEIRWPHFVTTLKIEVLTTFRWPKRLFKKGLSLEAEVIQLQCKQNPAFLCFASMFWRYLALQTFASNQRLVISSSIKEYVAESYAVK